MQDAEEHKSSLPTDNNQSESRAENRGKRKESSFVVESKVFEVGAEERKGKIQVTIVESKEGVSSWVRLGPASLGFFTEGLIQCIRDGKEGRWERDGRKKEELLLGGRRGDGLPWWSPYEIWDFGLIRRRINKKRGPRAGRMWKWQRDRGAGIVQGLEWRTRRGFREIRVVSGKCVGVEREIRFGKTGERDEFFWSLNSWRKLEMSSPLGRDQWEGFRWVWSDGVRNLGIDSQTERMEELEWARILVKTSGEELSGSLEIGVEEETTPYPCEWEVRDDGVTCAGMRVGEQSDAWPEEQLRSDDVTGGQVKGAGGEEFEQWAHFRPVTRLPSGSSGDGLSYSGPAEVFGPSEGRAANGLKFLPCGPTIMLGGSPGPS
ncbi:hypothetical protein CK203_035697 [Vitis vinifera]|uniref:DUF4283 domain-containing protein n=1 Tax=Vitis vinifera TaxID=29760 RepID=A0A438ICM2_VITVI|nr:hypothetical protein CK203_035697 [Vitis vinifera]